MDWTGLRTTINTLSALEYTPNAILALESILKQEIGSGRRITFTGVGKNGHIAKQLASTYTSVGIPSRYIDPVDILHGGMGTIIAAQDFIVYLSKSGNTQELSILANYLHNRGFDSLLVTSTVNPHANTTIPATEKICISVTEEMDKDNVVPTVSLIVYLTVLQMVGVSIANELGFHNKELFKHRHPGGTLGQIL